MNVAGSVREFESAAIYNKSPREMDEVEWLRNEAATAGRACRVALQRMTESTTRALARPIRTFRRHPLLAAGLLGSMGAMLGRVVLRCSRRGWPSDGFPGLLTRTALNAAAGALVTRFLSSSPAPKPAEVEVT